MLRQKPTGDGLHAPYVLALKTTLWRTESASGRSLCTEFLTTRTTTVRRRAALVSPQVVEEACSSTPSGQCASSCGAPARPDWGALSASPEFESAQCVRERERRERGRERSSRRRTRRRGIIPTPSARSFLRSPLRANTSALCKLTCASRLTCVTRPVHLRDNPRVTHASLFVLVYHCVVPR